MAYTKSKTIPELDGVRAFSILLVLASHLLPLGPKQLELNGMAGPMGMSLFFCLSGFLIALFLYEKPDIVGFFKRRIARIYPLLLVYAFLLAILFGGRFDIVVATMLFNLNYSDALLMHGNSHLWSICVEAHFYILIGLAVWAFGGRAFWLLPVAALAVLLMRAHVGAHVNIRTHLRVDEIFSGSLLALVWLNHEHPISRVFRQVAVRGLWIVLPLWMMSSHPFGGFVAYARPYFAMMLVGSVLFMHEGWIRQLCRHPWLGYIAKISYALYIWHPMMTLGWLGTGDRWTLYLIKRPITFALTFLFAHVSTHTLETYFIRLARSPGGFMRTARRSR